MTISQHEPCTTFLGPNARIFPVVTNASCYMQLFDLKPGSTWIPGKESVIYARRHLTRLAGTQVFGFYGPEFSWWIVWTRDLCRIMCRHNATRTYLFRFFLFYNCVQWGVDTLTPAIGNFAYGGQVVVSWRQ